MGDGGPTVTTWALALAEALAWNPRRSDLCDSHQRHATIDLTVNLTRRPTPDSPAAIGYAVETFPFRVFDASRYRDHVGYCTGDDEVSRGILACGAWEPWETLLFLDLLARGRAGADVVLDVGCHVGWYSTIAALMGYETVGVAADPEQVEVGILNAERAHVDGRVWLETGWVDETTWALPPPDGPWRVRVAKIDVENHEADAVRLLAPLLADRAVDYVLAEVSPEFDQGDAWSPLFDAGMRCWAVPAKGDDLDGYEEDPFGVTFGRRPIDPAAAESQTSVIFSL